MFHILANNYLPLIIIFGLLGFFGILIIVIIFVKRHFTSLQIKKDDIDEETAIQQELDRILVPIEDEKIQSEMNEAAKKESSAANEKKD